MKDRFDKETPNTDIISLKNVLLNDFTIGQNMIDHTTNFKNAWNRLATRSKQGTKNEKSYLYITKVMCELEEFKGVVYLPSLMDTYRDLCDTLAAREQRDYVDVRDFFLSRAAEKSEIRKETRHSLYLIKGYRKNKNVLGVKREVSNSTITLLGNGTS